LTSTVVNGQFTKIGGGLTYGTGFHFNNETGVLADLHRSPFAGIFVTGIYELTLPVHIAPSFTYFIPRTNKSAIATNAQNTRVSAMMFDLNGHYVFNSLDRFEFYGLAGLNITFAKIKWIGITSTGTDNAVGLNLGAGTYMKMTEQLDLLVEAKYIVSKYDQFMLNVGVLLNLQWLSKNENPGI
jgi:opacity protein-like surface antigen